MFKKKCCLVETIVVSNRKYNFNLRINKSWKIYKCCLQGYFNPFERCHLILFVAKNKFLSFGNLIFHIKIFNINLGKPYK